MLRNIIRFIFPDFYTGFSGGGGGDAGDIAKEEAVREANMALGSREINSLFGIHDPNNFNKKGRYIGTEGMYAGNGAPEGVNDGLIYIGPSRGLANSAYKNYQSREKQFDRSRQNIMNFFTHGLDEQLRDSTQAQTYDLARRGLLNGSEDLQAEAGRTRRYDDALIGLTNEADTSVNKMRTSDETARLGLLQNIRAGMDRESAMSGATNALTNNINNATNAAHATQFSGVFDDLNNLYKAGQYTKGIQGGINSPYGSSYSPGASGSSYSGTLYK